MENREMMGFFFNELLLNSSDDSSDEDDDVVLRGPIIRRPRIENYITEVVDRYSEQEFRENFRMNRATFNEVLARIQFSICTPVFGRGRATIPAKTQLLLALWYFGTPDSYRSICSRFNVGKATALRTVRRVAQALCELAPVIIKWPTGEDLHIVMEGFNAMGFPNTIGCLDGSYIKIPLPTEHGISYICRKNFPAIILQGVCDDTLKFTHCYIGEVGSTHDARVLRRSDLWTFINQRTEEMFPNDCHLVADKAYPCLPQLITPYRNNGFLTPQQTNFNYQLSCARNTIERAFGLLQKRFRCLKDCLDARSLVWIPQYVLACCVLHNICILQNDEFEIGEIDVNEDDVEEDVGDVPRARYAAGQQKRDRLCNILAAQR